MARAAFGAMRIGAALCAAIALLVAVAAPGAAQSTSTGRAARALRFDVELQLERDARLLVRETQEVAFAGGPFQKGTRRIPMRRLTRLTDLRVAIDGTAATRGRDVAGTFDVSGPTDGPSDGEVLVEWWFTRTSNARRTFVLEYTAHGAVAFYEPGDQLRWNALTSDRPYPIDSSTITLRLPVPVSEWKVDAYPGSLLDGEPSAEGPVAAWRAARLPPNQPLEVRAQWPHGVIAGTPPPWQEAADREAWRRESLRPVLNVAFGAAALLVVFGGGLTILLAWFTRGRDPDVGLVPEELDAPPSDLAPALAGTVVDEHADVQDVVATLLDLAARGVLSITEVIDRRLVGSQRDFELELLDRSKAHDRFELLLLDSVFRGTDEVRLSRLGDWFGSEVPRLQAALHAAAHRAGLFTADPEVVRRRYERVGSLLIAASVILGIGACAVVEGVSEVVWWPFIALIGVGAILRFAARAMPQRTAHGALEAARWRAYARHLRRVGPTAWSDGRAGDGSRAQDEIERTLPYAVALGADRDWVAKLSDAGTPAPRWMRRRPPVVIGGPFGPWGGPLGPWVGGGMPPARGPGRARGPETGDAAPPVVGGDAVERTSNSLSDLIQAASDVLGRGGSGGWSGGGFGGGSFSGGTGGSGGGGSGFE